MSAMTPEPIPEVAAEPEGLPDDPEVTADDLAGDEVDDPTVAEEEK